MAACSADVAARVAGSTGLRERLAGDWGVLFSDPEDFAPHPSTPRGFLQHVATQFATNHVKPLVLGRSRTGPRARCWLEEMTNDDCIVSLASDVNRTDRTVVDFVERALTRTVATLARPFVLVLDELGRQRLSLSYRQHHVDRPRTVEDLLRVVDVLRRAQSSSSCF